MEPNEGIKLLEVLLRDLIRTVLGDDWMSKATLNQSKLEARRTEEMRRRDGAVVDRNLLAYTYVYELRSIIEKNWEAFQPALFEKKRFEVYLGRVEDFRNAPAHSRTLLPFERDLLSGIVGEFRNVVTIYRSERGPDAKYYPSIESVVDSFGVEYKSADSLGHSGIPMRLRVGDQVTFGCRGWDAQGRALSWRLETVLDRDLDLGTGSDVTLKYTVSEADVRERVHLRVSMTSNGKFHRHGSYDDSLSVYYSVDPPDADI
jgi:hypothetical protein